MCGICVWIHRQGGVNPGRLAEAVGLLRHRGPDSAALRLWEPDGQTRDVDLSREPKPGGGGSSGGYRVGLGHSRLAILDLDPRSNQPMLSPDKKSALVYNGEIYDYIEVRRELEAAGETFATTSDTEVLLRSLLRDGPRAMRGMNGMWALALYESGHGHGLERLTLARDRYGKKPLFYYRDDTQFLAASEPKALFAMLGRRLPVDPDYLYGFLMGKRWPTFDDHRSMYRDVWQVPPGSSLVLDLASHRAEVRQDNAIEGFLDPDPDHGLDPARLPEELFSAVDLRLRSDVPVGVMVSGGVDSTAVAACAVRSSLADNVSFYTIDTNDDEDVAYARTLAQALGIRLIEVDARLTDQETLACYRDILAHFEVPVYLGLVVLPGYLVCRKMAEDGVRVALDGTGGDEVLGGYPGYFQLALENSMRARKWGYSFRLKRLVDQRPDLRSHGPVAGWLRWLRRTAMPGRRPREKQITDSRAELFGRHARLADHASLEAIIQECYFRDRLDEVTALQRYDLLKGQMPSYLYMVDQVSMIHSVETRSPLLDYRLYKYLGLPLHLKFDKGYNKYHFRRSLPDTVPDAVRWRRAKSGFALTPKGLFEGRRAEMEEMVRDSRVLGGLFDMDAMLGEWRGLKSKSHFKELVEHLYSVALLDDLVGLEV